MFKILVISLLIATAATVNAKLFSYEKFVNYTRGFLPSESGNELWYGIIKDCRKKVTFSCIQKNAYSYLDRTLIDRDNITVFDGLNLYKNNLDFDHGCIKDDLKDNLVEDESVNNEEFNSRKIKNEEEEEEDEDDDGEYKAPLEEVTHALRKKTVKFLSTRNYELRLPSFLANDVNLKISPRQIDSNGALIRIDFGGRAFDSSQEHGRIFFKKISETTQYITLKGSLGQDIYIKA